MKYLWIQSSIRANRTKTILLTLLFPIFLFVLILLVFGIEAFSRWFTRDHLGFWGYIAESAGMSMVIVIPILVIWFVIAFALHRQLIFKFSGAKPIDRKSHPEIFNIVENLCISRGLPTPNIGIMEDTSLNAFATWWKPGKSRIVFSKGILDTLDKKEIEAVAGHELTHIMNKDTLLMVCIVVFIGILGTLGEILIRSAGRAGGGKNSSKSALPLLGIGLGLIILGYLIFPVIRLAISRKREFLADAGSVELTKDKNAMISALQKISQDARIESIKKQTVAAMCIETPFKKNTKTHKIKRFHNMLSSHPPIEKRIETLKNY